MGSDDAVVVEVGGWVWFDGGLWEVGSLDARSVTLYRAGQVRRVSLSMLDAGTLRSEGAEVADGGSDPMLGVELAQLSKESRARLELEVEVLAGISSAVSQGASQQPLWWRALRGWGLLLER